MSKYEDNRLKITFWLDKDYYLLNRISDYRKLPADAFANRIIIYF